MVLYNILISLTKMIAPILSFTSEEIWQHIPGDREDSVFLADFPEVNQAFVGTELEAKWRKLQEIRDEVNKALEIKRQEKFIGNALEAKVSLFVGEGTYKLLAEYTNFLPTLFIVSAASVYKFTDTPGTSYKSSESGDLAVLVEKADGNKCQRCWNWKMSVGENEYHPELCERCCKVLVS
jgi:isoleucyl-tRNA synthetase